MLTLLKHGNFVSFFSSRTLANFADSIYFIALLWVVQTTFHSPAFTGFTFTALSVAAVFSFAFGPVIDRFSASALSCIAMLAQGVILLFIPMLAGPGILSFTLILVLVLLASVFSALFYPANMTLLPQILEDKELLVQGNALTSSSDQLINLIGFLLGGTLVAWLGAGVSFYVASAACFTGALLFWGLSRRLKKSPAQPRPEGAGTGGSPGRYLAELKEGLEFLWSQSFLRVLMILNVVANFSVSLLVIALPSLGESYGSALYYSGIYVAFFFGMILGAVSASALPKTGLWISMFWIGSGFSLLLFFLLPQAIGWKVLAIVLFGLCSGVVNVLQMSFIQLLTEERMMGRVMASVTSLSNLAIPLGSIIGGSLALRLQVDELFLLAGILIVICGAVMLCLKSVRSFSVRDTELPKGEAAELSV
ncbi:Permease [Paenibacillus mucilaginosus 3016]|uniref:Permease n=2 Tax=Paenibacillus mucilaginosus TaxID=61624 RepID=H6NAX7_9BACL|nr:MFS transporter [Paenibacillus mucilaginosus]AFC31232.1 Permease [Paenibacillus mucilaginosus 3016]AFH63551.1 permease [Paenibacillus mucilaginosus K02]WFA19797.1 MFS transporter [Paenibacillus mucilaginosus]